MNSSPKSTKKSVMNYSKNSKKMFMFEKTWDNS